MTEPFFVTKMKWTRDKYTVTITRRLRTAPAGELPRQGRGIAWAQRALHNCAIPPVPGRGRVFSAQRKDVMTYMRHYVVSSCAAQGRTCRTRLWRSARSTASRHWGHSSDRP